MCFFAKVCGGSGLGRNICKLVMKVFLLMLVLNTHATSHERRKKCFVFIVFYSLYYVYYFILKYLLFTIVAAFGKDLFSLKELEL